jgi:hypothetical protein
MGMDKVHPRIKLGEEVDEAEHRIKNDAAGHGITADITMILVFRHTEAHSSL